MGFPNSDFLSIFFNGDHWFIFFQSSADLEFSFIGTGAAKITKLNNNSLLKLNKIPNRQYSLQNFLRKIYLNLFKKIF